jgi:hypothetical protein
MKAPRNPNEVCPDAYAFVWYDVKDNTMNFLRNGERPLYFAFDKRKEQLFWSSEDVHLIAAMTDIPHEDKFLYNLPENQHYSFVIPNFGQAFGKPKIVLREGNKTIPLAQKTYGTGSNYSGGYGNQSYNSQDRLAKYDYGSGNDNTFDDRHLSRISWTNKVTGFWEKWNNRTKSYAFGVSENGKFYDSLQEVWDSLSDSAKLRRVISKEVPDGVESGYIYDTDKNMHVKIEDTETKNDSKPLNGGSQPIPTDFSKKGLSDNHQEITGLVQELKESQLKTVLGIIPTGTYKTYHSQNKRVYFDSDRKIYITYEYVGPHIEPSWKKTEYATSELPNWVPFTKLDVDARHQFLHIGKGKKRTTFFKGFKKEMLVKTTFEKLMKDGCVECHKTPQWGNDATFLNNTKFLCEHCTRNEDLVTLWQQAAS